MPKGSRAQFTLRLPTDQLEIYKQAAEDAGLALGDYIAELGWLDERLPTRD